MKLLWTALPPSSSIATQLNILCCSAFLVSTPQLLPLLVCLHHQRSAALEPNHRNSTNHNFNLILTSLHINNNFVFCCYLTSLCHQKSLRRCMIICLLWRMRWSCPNGRHLMVNSPCLFFSQLCVSLRWPLNGRGYWALRARASLEGIK